jgi:serine phosphatase RsbU (regulator of sigma subunit)
MLRRILRITLTFTAVLLLTSAFTQNSGSVKGVRPELVKVAYIYKFTNNIYWPNEDRMQEFIIGVMSTRSMLEQMQALESKALFRKRIPIKVTECKSPADVSRCHMVVIDAAGNHNLWAIYSKIKGKPILMVTENLEDYKKSMISFMLVDNKLKYIVNKTTMAESNLTVKEELYTFAITKEGEWKSIFDKFRHILQDEKNAGKDKSEIVDKSDIAEYMSKYQHLANEKEMRELIIEQMEDSLVSKIRALNEKMEEYNRLNEKIQMHKSILTQQAVRMEEQKKLIVSRDHQIGKQQTVITIIASLSFVVLLLLLVAIRENGQRRKANRLLSLQKSEVEKQKHLVEIKQKEILDSINYARRIQTALMSNESVFRNYLPEYFIVFKPKDIVAGDFFWAVPVKDNFMYITADSTGHGVPGAFMSLLNISKLNEAVNQKNIVRPDLVLNDVKRGLIEALNPEGSAEESKDGMDATLCHLDLQKMKLQYAAANNRFCIVRNNNILNCKADKMSIGKSYDDRSVFTFNELSIQKGDMIYTFTDGFADQFGGPEGKKLKYRKLKQILLTAAVLPIEQQKELFDLEFEKWRGSLDQVDDVLLIGVRV